MRFSNSLLVLSLIIAGTASQTVSATSGLRFLEYSPARYFTEQDWELARQTTRKALDEVADGDSVSWENPETGHGGTLTPLSSSEKDGNRCRVLRVENHANKLEATGNFEYCRQADGTWRAPQPPR